MVLREVAYSKINLRLSGNEKYIKTFYYTQQSHHPRTGICIGHICCPSLNNTAAKVRSQQLTPLIRSSLVSNLWVVGQTFVLVTRSNGLHAAPIGHTLNNPLITSVKFPVVRGVCSMRRQVPSDKVTLPTKYLYRPLMGPLVVNVRSGPTFALASQSTENFVFRRRPVVRSSKCAL